MLTDLEWKCLRAIADDFEELPQIKLYLRNHADKEISDEVIATSLERLVGLKLAKAYVYDEPKQDFVPLEIGSGGKVFPRHAMTWRPGESTSSRLWFYITKVGKESLQGRTAPRTGS